jgi:hypothetical protein
LSKIDLVSLSGYEIFFQDCGHKETADVIRSYGDKIIFVEQPDQSDIDVPRKELKFKGYFKIARHYGWALNETLVRRGYHQVRDTKVGCHLKHCIVKQICRKSLPLRPLPHTSLEK